MDVRVDNKLHEHHSVHLKRTSQNDLTTQQKKIRNSNFAEHFLHKFHFKKRIFCFRHAAPWANILVEKKTEL